MKTFWLWVLGLGTIAGGVLIWLSRKNPINNLGDAIEVQRLKEEIAKNASMIEELKGRGDEARSERAKLEAEISESKRIALVIATESPTRVYEKTDAEIAAEWTALGL